jgi:hypothetical protein
MYLAVIILALASLVAPDGQLTLKLKKSPKPALPKIDLNACPFEGCQFGKWTAVQPIPIYSTWEAKRRLLRSLEKSEDVTALTGIYITYEPAIIKVTAPMPEYGLKPGDTIFAYMPLGEGFFNAWFKGYWVEEFDGSDFQGPEETKCRGNCTGKFLKPGRTQWWVQVKTKDGTIGWTRDGDKFEGTDSLASSDGAGPFRNYRSSTSSKKDNARGSLDWPSQNIACLRTSRFLLVRAT